MLPERLGEVPPDEVLEHVNVNAAPRAFVVGGVSYTVKISSSRLRTFRRSRVCAICGVVGTRMVLELPIDTEIPHFNLYAEEDGELVLMTQDHVKPRSQGGGSEEENLRTACHTCNNIRGNDVTLTDDAIKAFRAARRWPTKKAATLGSPERLPLVPAAPPRVPTEAVNEDDPGSLAWALVRRAYAITGALAVGDRPRALGAAEEAQRLLGKLIGKLRASSMAA